MAASPTRRPATPFIPQGSADGPRAGTRAGGVPQDRPRLRRGGGGAPGRGDGPGRALDPVVLDQMAGMGLFGLPFPEEVGGMGADYTTLCLAIEELARVDSSVAITLEAAVGLGAMPIWRYGTAEQHQRWLRPLAAGEQLGPSRSPSRAAGRTPAPWPPGPPWTATSGSSTAPRRSSPTPAWTAPAWSPSPPSPASGPTAATRSPPSSCPPAPPGTGSAAPTGRSAGTRPTPAS